jgi:ribosome-binding factor A
MLSRCRQSRVGGLLRCSSVHAWHRWFASRPARFDREVFATASHSPPRRQLEKRPRSFAEENAQRDPTDDGEREEAAEAADEGQMRAPGRDLRPSVGQLRVAEMVRRILQRAILTGQFDQSRLDLRDVGFDIEDVHMSKDMGRATVFWNAGEVDTKAVEIQETIQKSLRILTYVMPFSRCALMGDALCTCAFMLPCGCVAHARAGMWLALLCACGASPFWCFVMRGW